MILHHLTSGILNHKTSIFIFLIKSNVWELGLKSWNGCLRKVSSPRMVLEVLGLKIQVAFKRARWVKPRFSLNLARCIGIHKPFGKPLVTLCVKFWVNLVFGSSDGRLGPSPRGAMPLLHPPWAEPLAMISVVFAKVSCLLGDTCQGVVGALGLACREVSYDQRC
ncbi:hypothetical protein L6452_24530 [Arctium lappa]|uniref:Uncharacterized protein n=1 Tax=Arctium lappa TaxID=4217 RepID=A0ACB9A9W8_ARCLA|nr:hypothetical protein L6452_24530 [Arctium lappa]